jgi:hypothetical protein
VLDLLDQHQIPATFFTTAHFAVHESALMQRVASRHEVASHGYYHSSFEESDLRRSREVLEELVDKPVVGFRRARLMHTDHEAIERAGYRYNSSENPIYLPGRYNNFFRPRRVYLSGNLLNVPISATPIVRFPLFWLSFKNLPLTVLKAALSTTLKADGYLNLFFHPWEFTDLGAYALPGYVKRLDGAALVARLNHLFNWLGQRGRFVTFSDFDRQVRQSQRLRVVERYREVQA